MEDVIIFKQKLRSLIVEADELYAKYRDKHPDRRANPCRPCVACQLNVARDVLSLGVDALNMLEGENARTQVSTERESKECA